MREVSIPFIPFEKRPRALEVIARGAQTHAQSFLDQYNDYFQKGSEDDRRVFLLRNPHVPTKYLMVPFVDDDMAAELEEDFDDVVKINIGMLFDFIKIKPDRLSTLLKGAFKTYAHASALYLPRSSQAGPFTDIDILFHNSRGTLVNNLVQTKGKAKELDVATQFKSVCAMHYMEDYFSHIVCQVQLEGSMVERFGSFARGMKNDLLDSLAQREEVSNLLQE